MTSFPSVRIRRAVAWAALALLTYLLLTPHPLALFGAGGQATEEAVDHTLSGTLQHVIAYTVLTIVLHLGGLGLWAGLSGVVVLACGHGAVCELLQSFVPMRTADWIDAAANVAGAMLGGASVMVSRFVRSGRGD